MALLDQPQQSVDQRFLAVLCHGCIFYGHVSLYLLLRFGAKSLIFPRPCEELRLDFFQKFSLTNVAAQVLDLSTAPPIEIGVSWPGFTLTVTDVTTGQLIKFVTEPGWEFQSDIKYPSSQIRYRVNVAAVADGVLAFTMASAITQTLPRLGRADWDFLLKNPQGNRVRDYKGVLKIEEAVTVWR